tara:strand:- start:6975 stop:8246 length:1272 start_codon:yes stop_codon:yes gene_type:complete
MNLSCKINLPILSAIIVYFSLRKIKKIKNDSNNKTTFLVLHKEGGIDDLICAYENKTSKITYLNLNRKFIKIIYDKFLKNKLHDYDYNYFDKVIVENKKKYFFYLEKVIYYLKKFKKFNGIINFNVFYYADVELQKVCKKQKIKFFTLHKESLHPPILRKCMKWIYKNTSSNFYGDKIFLYNQYEKKLLVESNICKPHQIKVVGMPRLSQSYKIKKFDIDNSKYKNNIILYQSQEKYLPYFKNKHFKKPSHPLFDSKFPFSFENTEIACVKILKKIAKKRNIKITIKTRTGQRQAKFKKIYRGLNIVSGGAGHRLLEKNQIVIAFNSTIIFEALAAGKIVFTPNFVKDFKKNSGYFFDLFQSTHLDRNIKSFEKNINEVLDKNLKNKKIFKKNYNIKKMLNRYLHNSDNKAGKRLIRELEKYA